MKKLKIVLTISSALFLLILGLFIYQPYLLENNETHRKNNLEEKIHRADNKAAKAENTDQNRLATSSRTSSNLLKDYFQKSYGKGLAGSNLLDEIRSLREPLSIEDLKKIGNLIKNGKLPSSELASLIRLYADQIYLGADDQEVRSTIENILQTTKEKEVGAAAALTLSRISKANDVANILKIAKASEFLTENDYYGEVAHNIFRVPPAVQKEWIDSLKNSGNLYARQIVTDNIARSEKLLFASNEQFQQLTNYLLTAEPEFSKNSAEFGLFTAIDYQNWVKAVAKVESAAGLGSPDNLIAKRLMQDGIDQRKVLAFMLEEENVNQLEKIISPEQKQHIADTLASFLSKHPNDLYADALRTIYPKIKN